MIFFASFTNQPIASQYPAPWLLTLPLLPVPIPVFLLLYVAAMAVIVFVLYL
jgi:hypothetical protein